MRIFVDTSAFIALEDRSESRHPRARSFYENLAPSDRLFTSNYVVDETITRLRYTIGHAAALGFADAVLASRLCSLLYVDRAMETRAVEVLRKYKDKKLSFTDCTSMALAASHRLDAVFAFDDDFSSVGFQVLP